MRQNQQVSFPVPGAVYKGCSKDQRLTSARCKLTAPGPRGPRTPSRSACPRHREQGCCKVRPVEGRSCSAALKSEDRRPKPERRPKSEFREWPDSIGCCSAGVAINSDFGLRVSGLEWPGPTLEQSCTGSPADHAVLRKGDSGARLIQERKPLWKQPWIGPAIYLCAGLLLLNSKTW